MDTLYPTRADVSRKLLHLDTIFIPTTVVPNTFWDKPGQAWDMNAVIFVRGILVGVKRNWFYGTSSGSTVSVTNVSTTASTSGTSTTGM